MCVQIVNAIPIEKIPSNNLHENNQQLMRSRLSRWKQQRLVQSLLPNERVAFCMRRVQHATVDVCYSPDHQSAHYSGLMVCGSVWVCPLCAVKISERRREEIERAIAHCLAKGGGVYLATYTISHHRCDELSELLSSFLSARKKMRQGRAAQEIRRTFGVLGTISVREVTWSKRNGWHPHCHELVFFEGEVDILAYEEAVRKQWYRSAEYYGLSMNEHGFQLDRTYGAVADYVAKFGREPMRSPWSVTAEMTKSHLKKGHDDEHLTPFALLDLIATGHHEFEPLFLEYAQWFKGKHQLVWSAGLRAKLLCNDEEKTDLELVQEAEESILLGRLNHRQWRTVLRYDVRGELLEVARSGNWQAVLTFLSSISIHTSSTRCNYEHGFHDQAET
jgi:hypothetical protein